MYLLERRVGEHEQAPVPAPRDRAHVREPAVSGAAHRLLQQRQSRPLQHWVCQWWVRADADCVDPLETRLQARDKGFGLAGVQGLDGAAHDGGVGGVEEDCGS